MYNGKSYFAAANGYGGFRSYFDKVFSPLKLSKLYILKGGPGTGKSTLMKKLAGEFESSLGVTRILCSSDTASLDGVMFEENGIVVGIADGTAPHVIEPQYPGAVEEIVNLGDGFDYRALRGAVSEITELSKRKKTAYQRGYSALKAAGVIYEHIKGILSDIDIYNLAEELITNEIKCCNNNESTVIRDHFLLSSFSKDGHTYLPLPSVNKNLITVHGDGVSEQIFMEKVGAECVKNHVSVRILHSPLSDCVPDVIELADSIYAVSRDNAASIDSSQLFSKVSGYSGLREAYKELLKDAKVAFCDAAQYHFKLEDIYSKSTSFNNNDAAKDRISREIAEIFDK